MMIIRSFTTPGGLVAPAGWSARTNRRSKQSNRAEWRAFMGVYLVTSSPDAAWRHSVIADARDGMFIRDSWPRLEEPARRASHADRQLRKVQRWAIARFGGGPE